MHGQLRLNEWINLSCMKDERKNWLAFPSSLFGVLLMVRDFSGHHVAGSMSFSFFFLSLSLSFWLYSCRYITLCSLNGVLLSLFRFYYHVLMVYICRVLFNRHSCRLEHQQKKKKSMLNFERLYSRTIIHIRYFSPHMFFVVTVNAKWVLGVSWFFFPC